MGTYSTSVEGHDIELFNSRNNSEVYYDRRLVSKKNSFWDTITIHEFDATENEETVHYVVRACTPFGFVIRRNGEIVYELKRTLLRVLVGIAVMGVVADLFDAAGLTPNRGDTVFGWEDAVFLALYAAGVCTVAWLMRRSIRGGSG